MTVGAIPFADYTNPSEVQLWLDSHPGITIHEVVIEFHTFYIFYE